MGFQVRKRTKGKTNWLNYSFSKRGANASASMKTASGDTTLNVNANGKRRVTVNLGNGVKYVFDGPPKKKTIPKVKTPKSSYKYTSTPTKYFRSKQSTDKSEPVTDVEEKFGFIHFVGLVFFICIIIKIVMNLAS